MPVKCCVVGCQAKYGQKKVSFHSFPIVRTARDTIRRELWIEAVGMKGKDISNRVICGHHFITGKPAHSNDTDAENWIPSLRLGNQNHFETGDTSENPDSSLPSGEYVYDDESIILLEDNNDQDILLETSDDLFKDKYVNTDYQFDSDTEYNYSSPNTEFVDMNEEWLEDEECNPEQSREEILLSYEDELKKKDCEIQRLEKIIEEQGKKKSISFISKPYTGRTSDKYITDNSGFLNYLGQGDLVLADRGFTVRKSIEDKGATLKVPESASKKSQMSSAAVERTRALASVRNEVDRAIGSLRQKYEILTHRVPITLLNHEHNGEAVLDMIVVVCCALFNLCPSIIVDIPN